MAKIYKWVPDTETLDLNKKVVRFGDHVKDSDLDKDTLVKLVAKGKLVPANGEIVVVSELSEDVKNKIADLEKRIAESIELNESLKSDLANITEERDSLQDSLDQANAKIEELEKAIIEPTKEPEPKEQAKGKKVEY